TVSRYNRNTVDSWSQLRQVARTELAADLVFGRATFGISASHFGQCTRRPQLSYSQPHSRQVQPPQSACWKLAGLRTVGAASPQLGQKVGAPLMPHFPWRRTESRVTNTIPNVKAPKMIAAMPMTMTFPHKGKSSAPGSAANNNMLGMLIT